LSTPTPPYQFAKTGITNQTIQLVPGLPGYLLGSYNRLVPPSRMYVQSVALSGTTATVVVRVIEGQIPVVGQLISISGAVPSYFNVTNVAITGVSLPASPDLGIFTITFTLVNSGQTTIASPGLAVAPQLEVGSVLVAGSSIAAALQSNVNPANGRSVRFDISFPTLPGAALVYAQSADLDIDTEYQNLGTVASVTGGVVAGASTNGPNGCAVIFTGVTAGFVRVTIPQSGLAGYGGATIVCKVSI
jgi:hypothetical protein